MFAGRKAIIAGIIAEYSLPGNEGFANALEEAYVLGWRNGSTVSLVCLSASAATAGPLSEDDINNFNRILDERYSQEDMQP